MEDVARTAIYIGNTRVKSCSDFVTAEGSIIFCTIQHPMRLDFDIIPNLVGGTRAAGRQKSSHTAGKAWSHYA